ncbi:hypothetical protein DGG96_19790 [Legionella qingyii]|uniref:Uncharacterized protein n=1 Tax=Legionella qingyii TaxID=2184757 RepID=A0A317TWZ7_9GAMM|nr:hypothetical protein DGG96_19790 [Legionella qingyii]
MAVPDYPNEQVTTKDVIVIALREEDSVFVLFEVVKKKRSIVSSDDGVRGRNFIKTDLAGKVDVGYSVEKRKLICDDHVINVMVKKVIKHKEVLL